MPHFNAETLIHPRQYPAREHHLFQTVQWNEAMPIKDRINYRLAFLTCKVQSPSASVAQWCLAPAPQKFRLGCPTPHTYGLPC